MASKHAVVAHYGVKLRSLTGGLKIRRAILLYEAGRGTVNVHQQLARKQLWHSRSRHDKECSCTCERVNRDVPHSAGLLQRCTLSAQPAGAARKKQPGVPLSLKLLLEVKSRRSTARPREGREPRTDSSAQRRHARFFVAMPRTPEARAAGGGASERRRSPQPHMHSSGGSHLTSRAARWSQARPCGALWGL